MLLVLSLLAFLCTKLQMLTRGRAHATAARYNSSRPDPSDEEAADDDATVADEAPAAAAVRDRAAMSALARELEVWGGFLTRPQVYEIREGSLVLCVCMSVYAEHVCVCTYMYLHVGIGRATRRARRRQPRLLSVSLLRCPRSAMLTCADARSRVC